MTAGIEIFAESGARTCERPLERARVGVRRIRARIRRAAQADDEDDRAVGARQLRAEGELELRPAK